MPALEQRISSWMSVIRATQELIAEEQLPVGRLSPCPAGLFTQRKWVESDYGVMIHHQVLRAAAKPCIGDTRKFA